jgi:divalent metal cation (Fe/Co/Zn/Cd) transporter
MEPLGIIVFSSIMATASLQIFIESIQRLVSHDGTVDIDVTSLCILAVVIAGKFAMWMVCRRYKDSPSIMTLSQEHRNDFLLNFFSTILMFVTVQVKINWLDSAGAICLAMYIMRNWTETGLGEFCGSLF